MKKLFIYIFLLALIVVAVIFVKKQWVENLPAPADSHADLIKVSAPTSGQMITSPVLIKGEARGNWYFEASFPAHLYDANGQELAVFPVQAQGEWMTTDFVPFEIYLGFKTPSTSTGTLVLEKDNPSGLPEHDDSISIPVRFSN